MKIIFTSEVKSLFLCVFLFQNLLLSAHALSWIDEKPALGSVNLEGGLERRFSLGAVRGSSEFSLPITLEHRLIVHDEQEVKAGESVWEVPQLRTGVAPEGRTHLAWVRPGGSKIKFKLSGITGTWKGAWVSGWQARQAGKGVYEFRNREGFIYTYSKGNIRSLASVHGRVLEFETEGARITKITQKEFKEPLLVARYDSHGKVESLQVAQAKHSFEYNGVRLSAWKTEGLKPVTIAYKNDLVSQITDRDGVGTSYTWRLGGKNSGPSLKNDGIYSYLCTLGTVTKTDGLKREEKLEVQIKRGVIVHTGYDGNEQEIQMGGAEEGRTVSVRGADGKTLMKVISDTEGRVVSKKALGQPALYYKYDARGRMVSISRENQVWLRLEYEKDFLKPSRMINALGQATEIRYDENQQPVATKNAEGAETKISYDSAGRVLKVEGPMGSTASFEYDGSGRLVGKRSVDGRESRLSYDALGRVSQAVEDGHEWELIYDEVGRLQKMMRDKKPWLSVAHETDVKGKKRTATLTPPTGGKETRVYDLQGRLLSETDPLGATTAYQYDAAGQLVGWKDARGGWVKLVLDKAGRVVEQGNAVGQKTVRNYDKSGHLQGIDNGEQKIRYSYDEYNRLKGVDYGDGQTVSTQRDSWGRVVQSSAGDVTTQYLYDELDRVVAFRDLLPDAGVQGIAYEYAPSGHRAKVSLFRQDSVKKLPPLTRETVAQALGEPVQTTAYDYDMLGRMTQIRVNDQTAARYEYDPSSLRLKSKVLGDGSRLEYGYDGRGLPTLAQVHGADGQEKNKLAYGWNDYGQLSERVWNGVKQSYRYDAVGRLTQGESATGEQSEAYSYDPAGNLLKKELGGQEEAMEYDLANQIQAAGGRKFQYDAAGRLAEESTEGDKTRYTYGYLDKVLAVEKGGKKNAVSYRYNAAGLPVQKIENGRCENLLWDGIALASRGEATYANEPHLSGGVPVMVSQAGTKSSRYPVQDYLGSSVGIIKDGAFQPIRLSAFGEVDGKTGVEEKEIRFTGKPFDRSLKSYRYPFRDYRPELARWTSADPIGFPDGPNQHFYAAVPNMGMDVMGLDYLDISFSYGSSYGVGVIGGIYVSPSSTGGFSVSPYIGGGLMTTGPAGSISFSPNNVSPKSWSWQVSATVPQTGVGVNSGSFGGGVTNSGNDGFNTSISYVEAGIGLPNGVSATTYYTFDEFMDLFDFDSWKEMFDSFMNTFF